MSVRKKTTAAGPAWKAPIIAASRPDGCECIEALAASATFGATIARSLPSFAIVRGSRPPLKTVAWDYGTLREVRDER